MKSLAWLPLVALVGSSAAAWAQPPSYAPAAGPWGPESATPPMPYANAPDGASGWGAPPAGWGDTAPTGPAAQASAVLKEGMDKLLAYLAQKEVPNQLQVAAFLDREIAPYFDFDYMAQWVAGPAYSGMTPEERKALAAQLESEFLGALTRHLAGYNGQQVRLLPPRRGPRGSVNIPVAVMRAGDYPTTLQFRLSESKDGWKVYDVVANGQSAAAYYRNQFQQMARRMHALPR